MGDEEDRTYEGHDLEALVDLPRYHAWMLETFRPYLSGYAAEFGAGIGTLSAKLLPYVSQLDVVEPSANLLPRLREAVRGGPATVFDQHLEAYLDDCSEESLDCLVMINVLEHVADDKAVLRACRQTLRPGHHLLLFVPAIPSLYAPIDTLLGHYRRYRLSELVGKVEEAGFTVELAEYRDAVGVLAWWLVHKKLGRTSFSPKLARLYDSLCVPLTRTLESLLPLSFGKNIILVARR
jgi:SAM-dependent methyltransferase